MIDFDTPDLLWRHIVGRPEHAAGLGRHPVGQPGNTEIGNLYLPCLRDDNVCGLDVAMRHAETMRVGYTAEYCWKIESIVSRRRSSTTRKICRKVRPSTNSITI